MKSAKAPFATGKSRAALAALISLLLASCSSTGETNLELAMPEYTASADAADASASPEDGAAAATTAANIIMGVEGNTALPGKVAYVPLSKPGGTPPALAAAANEEAPQIKPEATAAAQPVAAQPEPKQIATADSAKPAAPAVQQDTGFYLTAGTMPESQPAPKKKGFLSSLFGATPTSAKPVQTAPTQAKAEPAKAKPIITLASAEPASKKVAVASLGASPASGGDSEFTFPGVRKTALFEITRKSGLDDDSDVDVHEDEEPSLQLASAAGMARLAPNGLLKQHNDVDVACLKPSLVRMLKAVEQRYGKKMIITSGYRNPERNRRANGAKNSLHMYCAAVDMQIPGVSKWELAKYVRAMPGRGGVGTYCHTNSIHIDVGPERDWNWRCRRTK